MTDPQKNIFVYGAYGHTGRFVASELRRRGWRAVLSGRDPAKLSDASASGDDVMRVASVDDADSLDNAVQGCSAILNCAGPFADTAPPLIETALRAGLPYLDVSAEPRVVSATIDHFSARAAAAGATIMPCAAFYGALPDLLTSLAMGDWRDAQTVSIGFALDSWKPTAGTLAAMRRMAGERPVFADGSIVVRTGDPVFLEHAFPEPAGRQAVMADYPGCESVLIPHHIATSNVKILMATAALKDLRDPETSGPVAVDQRGRSDQQFLVHVEVQRGEQTRSAWASGKDIYATTATIMVEAMERILAGKASGTGMVSAAMAFDAADFLAGLAPDGVRFATC